MIMIWQKEKLTDDKVTSFESPGRYSFELWFFNLHNTYVDVTTSVTVMLVMAFTSCLDAAHCAFSPTVI